MRIAILFERYLAEYGADRVHLEQARAFRRAGHEVYLFGRHFSEAVLSEFSGCCVRAPASGGFHSDDDVALHVRKFFRGFKKRGLGIDVAIHGGWPYISALAETKAAGARTVFVDFGVVPEYGYDAALKAYLRAAKARRAKYLPGCDNIVSISDFIYRSQALLDAPHGNHSVIHLAGNHMDRALKCAPTHDDTFAETLFENLQASFDSIVLQLGRFEPNTYKFSEEIFALAEAVLPFFPRTAFCYLAPIDNSATPKALRSNVFSLGRPSDAVLYRIMSGADLTISPSEWEGYNLPLLEAQWIGKPCLVKDVAAHPEVVWSKALLCEDRFDLCGKTLARLRARDFSLGVDPTDVARHKATLTWERMGAEYLALFEDARGRASSENSGSSQPVRHAV